MEMAENLPAHGKQLIPWFLVCVVFPIKLSLSQCTRGFFYPFDSLLSPAGERVNEWLCGAGLLPGFKPPWSRARAQSDGVFMVSTDSMEQRVCHSSLEPPSSSPLKAALRL